MSRQKSTPRPVDPGDSIAIRVIPRAGRSAVAGLRGGAILVRLAAAPVDSAANDELVALLAGLLDLPRHAITIVSGERSRLKRVRVSGLDRARVFDTLLASAR
jgi:uncharacterized protein YggU (UPF0235/DUF167 family)